MRGSFGKHSDAVEEVIAWVRSDALLKGRFLHPKDADFPTKVIHDLCDVDRFRDPEWDDAEIEGPEMWFEIKAQDDGAFLSKIHGDESFKDILWPKIKASCDELWPYLCSSLGEILPEDEISTVSDDLYNLALTRAALGRTNLFFEKLFKTYQHSGYPCGWSGRYPGGRLVVFSR